MWPASRASWMVCSELTMLIPTPVVPSSNGTKTSITNVNSTMDAPRKLFFFINVCSLGCNAFGRHVPRWFNQIVGRCGDRGRGFVSRLSPGKQARHQGRQRETLDRDLHDIPG